MDNISNALKNWNPWHETGEIPAKLIGKPRQKTTELPKLLSLQHIKIFYGIRRAGKSTILYQLMDYLLKNKIAEKNQILLVNYEDNVLKSYSLEEIYNDYKSRANGKKIYFFADEVQKKPGWEEWVRSMYDRKENVEFFLSGSSANLMRKEYATLFTGRNITQEIYPLEFSEYLGFFCPEMHKAPTAKNCLQHYIEYGGFPEIALASDDTLKRDVLNHYFEDILYKDIAGRYSINAEKAKSLAVYLITNISKPMTLRKIRQALGLGLQTSEEYLGYFKESMLLFEVFAYSDSLREQAAMPRKIYCIDTGLRNAISFRTSEDRGRLIENLVFNHLHNMGKKTYYWKGKKECDFVVKEGFKITRAIQVCAEISDEKTEKREEAGLIEAMEKFKLGKGIIITEDMEKKKSFGKMEISYIPIWKWLAEES